ncbi:MAG: hypothetical protein EX271_08750 [Acidimicrobiales bacterium]|nr:hypothetical protein [Hyphomonadaceae bacterium]RZV41096.1 MAG: hypothetical protein EX271_08750 [Acidimicrobiales bacterium]
MTITLTPLCVPTDEKLWAHRPKLGPYPYYEDPNEPWLDCISYFEWVEAHPVPTVDVMKYAGEATVIHIPRPRPMTQAGLCVYLGIAHQTWQSWRQREEPFADVVATVDSVIFEHKFTGACVGLFNPALVARELGLMTREPEQPLLFAPEDLPTITADMTAATAADLYARELES